ncbi:MAG TPA: hypothetical protein VHF22_04880, partial [Planctomycetota bacterium]|nr:hypothetical protein [Planctomycetota bacterium]
MNALSRRLAAALVAILGAGAAPAALATTYSDVILGDHPVGFWRLDETSGTAAADGSGGGHD